MERLSNQLKVTLTQRAGLVTVYADVMKPQVVCHMYHTVSEDLQLTHARLCVLMDIAAVKVLFVLNSLRLNKRII